MNVISTFYQGEVLNDDLACLGPCWSLLMPFDALTPYFVIVESYGFFAYFLYVRVGVILLSKIFPTIGLSIFRVSSLILKPYY